MFCCWNLHAIYCVFGRLSTVFQCFHRFFRYCVMFGTLSPCTTTSSSNNISCFQTYLSVIQWRAFSSSVQTRLDDISGTGAHASPTTSGHVTRTPARPFDELAVTWARDETHLLGEICEGHKQFPFHINMQQLYD